MMHLKCIEQTKEVLTKDQLLFLLANKNKHATCDIRQKEDEEKIRLMKFALETPQLT